MELPRDAFLPRTLKVDMMMPKIKEYKNYLFDADGTLFDTTGMIIKCFHHTAYLHGLPVPSAEHIIGGVGMTLRAQMESYFGKMDDTLFERYRDTHMSYQMTIYRDHLVLCPGVAEALHGLKSRGKKCAVVTSRMMETLALFLRDRGIIDFFEALITPESTARHKPLPEPALEALRQLGGIPEETLFIGDSRYDMECGKSAGCATAFVLWSGTDAKSLVCAPDHLLENMMDLCRW